MSESMVRVLFLLVAASDVVLTMVVFVAWARPDRLTFWLAGQVGVAESWRAGTLDYEQEEALEDLARRVRWLSLGLVFL
ncbi:MAG: hypothetical protein QGG40_01110, partial [Myxococcota bacterium]|nr:hypothetical protein [Myxococcota bacterium]